MRSQSVSFSVTCLYFLNRSTLHISIHSVEGQHAVEIRKVPRSNCMSQHFCVVREGPWILGGFCKVGVNLHFGRKSLIKVSQTHTQTHIHTYTHIDLQLWHVSFVWRSFTTDITIRVVFSKSFWNKKTNIFGNNWIIKKIIIYVTWVGSYLQKKLFYMIKTLF